MGELDESVSSVFGYTVDALLLYDSVLVNDPFPGRWAKSKSGSGRGHCRGVFGLQNILMAERAETVIPSTISQYVGRFESQPSFSTEWCISPPLVLR